MTITRYSRLKAMGCCFGSAAFTIYVLVMPFTYPGGYRAYLMDGNYWSRFYPVVAILSVVSIFFIVRLAVNVTTGAAVAISLDGDLLRLISGTVIQIQIQDIDRVGLKKGGAFPLQFNYLCFYLKNSKLIKVPTFLFDGSAQGICNNVRVALGQAS